VDEQPETRIDRARSFDGSAHEGEAGTERRTWFVMRELELDWLPVSESAFLLWVLALLLLAWLAVALVFVVR
jgi:hypothetical protein